MNVLAIVPARGGSKRVPGKNLRPLGDKSLVARSIEAARSAPSVAKVVVSSDDEAVLAIARAYPDVVALKRPAAISGDDAPAIDYVRHVFEALGPAGAAFDAVAIIQPSSPFTLSADIDATVAVLDAAPQADSAVSVVELEHAIHPAKLKRLEGTKLVPYLEAEAGRMAAHELPKVFVRNCSVYVTRRSCLDNKGSIIGDDSRAYVMPRERSLDINDEVDWSFAEFMHARMAKQPGPGR